MYNGSFSVGGDMAYIDFIEAVHTGTKRNYLERVIDVDKAECAIVAKRFDREFFDGERKYGYGGYRYDGRWESVARKMIDHYHLKPGQKILDVGCGKAHLLYEFKKLIPGIEVAGIDISEYAIEHAMEEVKPFLRQGNATWLEYDDNTFDLVISLATIHNLQIFDLKKAVEEISRVNKGNSYIMTDSYRNDYDKTNLLYWQLTCESIFSDKEWEWLYQEWGYSGDYSFIFFE